MISFALMNSLILMGNLKEWYNSSSCIIVGCMCWAGFFVQFVFASCTVGSRLSSTGHLHSRHQFLFVFVFLYILFMYFCIFVFLNCCVFVHMFVFLHLAQRGGQRAFIYWSFAFMTSIQRVNGSDRYIFYRQPFNQFDFPFKFTRQQTKTKCQWAIGGVLF